MFVRNLLQSGNEVALQGGQYVTLVPFGIPITVQYTDKGLIQKIMINHEESEWDDVTESFLPLILRNQQIPNKIFVTGGSSFVRGAFVTPNVTDSLRKHPTSLIDEFKQMYVANPVEFTFYAGDITSTATTFRGAVATRQWLSASKFTLLPGYVVSHDISEERFRSMVTQNYPFTYPLISSYILYHQDYSITYPKIQLKQSVIKSIQQSYTEVGDITSQIVYTDGDIQVVPYSTTFKFNLQQDSLVIRNSEGTIIHSIVSAANAKKSKSVSNIIQCKCCGRQIVVPSSGNVRCLDEHCNSVMYPRVLQLCKTLKLPYMSFDEYMGYADEIGSIFSILDIFDLDKYKSKVIEVSLAEGLRAIVPRNILSNMRHINEICDGCSNSVQTLEYYIQHPSRMQLELGLDDSSFGKFIKWIEDPENCSDVIEFFKLSNINVVKPTRRFEGDPIFRDKTVMITGTFVHGSADEVSSILRSYSAEVTTSLEDTVSCVVIGDSQENVDGHAVIEARRRRIPIMTESQFFTRYDIDADLAENL